jgi:signal transduction histidine kinase
MDLAPALARRIDDFARRSGLRCRRELPTQCPLPVEVAETALRVFDEAASNIWRHAAASEVCIALTSDAAGFDMRIEDNGRGFVIGEGRGMGLDSMEARARGIGARLEIDSRPGEGARLRLHGGAA